MPPAFSFFLCVCLKEQQVIFSGLRPGGSSCAGGWRNGGHQAAGSAGSLVPRTENLSPWIKKSTYLLLTRLDRIPCPGVYILRGGSLATQADLPALAGASPPSLRVSGPRCRAMGRRGTIPHPPAGPTGRDGYARSSGIIFSSRRGIDGIRHDPHFSPLRSRADPPGQGG